MPGIIRRLKGLRKHIKFNKAVLDKCQKDFPNPGRGWYRIYTFRLDNIDYNGINWLYYNENETLALLLIDIGAYSTRDIDINALDFFRNILNKFKEKGKEIILRIVYDTEGKGIQKEPSLFSQVCIHMQQLGSIVKEHADNIFLCQGLFIGSWGEMHTSKFLSNEKLKILYATWQQETGGSVKISFRKPVQARIVTGPKKSSKNTTWIGIFDDAIAASPTHLGTFGEFEDEEEWEKPWCRKKELKFIKETAAKIPCGGEAVAGMVLPSPEETISLLKDMNISYLNCIHSEKMLNYWKTQNIKGYGSLYSYISMHLGYRIIIKNVKAVSNIFANNKAANSINTNSINANSINANSINTNNINTNSINAINTHMDSKEPVCICIKITLENSGFSCIYFETEFKLVIEDTEGNIYEKEIPFDLRELKPGSIAEAVINFNWDIKKDSKLFARLLRKRDKEPVQFGNTGDRKKLFLGSLGFK